MPTQLQLIKESTNNSDRVITRLKEFTNARIAQGHSGGQTLTKNWLLLQKDFALAKDAVLKQLDLLPISQYIVQQHNLPLLKLTSQANGLDEFLARPDLGRQLSHESRQQLHEMVNQHPQFINNDIAIVISAGLSATAIQTQLLGFLDHFLALIQHNNWSLAPLILSEHTRVAFADKVNTVLKAKMLVVLIGERPGLSSYDSMGIYFTYNSQNNTTDDKRNCISNIHTNGLTHELAAQKLTYLINKAFLRKETGVNLKDDFDQTEYLTKFK